MRPGEEVRMQPGPKRNNRQITIFVSKLVWQHFEKDNVILNRLYFILAIQIDCN